jgi:hypothetical protein
MSAARLLPPVQSILEVRHGMFVRQGLECACDLPGEPPSPMRQRRLAAGADAVFDKATEIDEFTTYAINEVERVAGERGIEPPPDDDPARYHFGSCLRTFHKGCRPF